MLHIKSGLGFFHDIHIRNLKDKTTKGSIYKKEDKDAIGFEIKTGLGNSRCCQSPQGLETEAPLVVSLLSEYRERDT